jgi:predicted secreted protein
MAAVKHARGVKLLLKVGNGVSPEAFTAYCTINAARSIKGTTSTNEFNIPDCDDPDLLAWVTREKVAVSYTVSGAGILNTPDVQAFADWLSSADTKNCEIVVDVASADGGVIFEGAFHLTDFEITGDRGGKMEANISLASSGEVTVVANS